MMTIDYLTITIIIHIFLCKVSENGLLSMNYSLINDII